ncbi:pentatricopeptide repeat-containing protein At3g21470-like [Zingiber officinale]|uniref:pentatricopeptide repeat-containing protein At3g21470-like n=1 Tax=Zingiber officinale TaxID=94328 RepID=UPI001C4BC3B0|nr:pentatricopeptide repeat-containing protein At3g21470-like [Zingiber officinale]
METLLYIAGSSLIQIHQPHPASSAQGMRLALLGAIFACRMNARKMFDEMPKKNAVTFSTMISEYSMSDMESSLELLRCLFDRVSEKSGTVITWTVMVHGHTVNGDLEAARALFDQMSVKNVFVWSSMITGYFKKGDSKLAQSLFEKTPVRNLVNWNALIAGYIQIGCYEKALEAFEQMQEDRFQPDELNIASLLSACGQLDSLHHGKMIHKIIKRSGITMNL